MSNEKVTAVLFYQTLVSASSLVHSSKLEQTIKKKR